MTQNVRCFKHIKSLNKVLKILILGGGPTGLFAGYKLLKKGNEITIFEKRRTYVRKNILSLQETTKLDTLSLIPSEIMDHLNTVSSFSHINATIETDYKKCQKNLVKNKPYLMVSSRVYYIVLNELESAYEKYFKLCGGNLIKPSDSDYFTNITINNNILKYHEKETIKELNLEDYDVIMINDGANSFYRNVYFEKTSYTENIELNIIRYGLTENYDEIKVANYINDINPLAFGITFEHNIEDKEYFQKKFMTRDKIKKKIDFDTVFKLENQHDNFMGGLNVKEILIENNFKEKPKSFDQNIYRMFISENCLYISIMIHPKDVGDFYENNKNRSLVYNELPDNVKVYIKFAIYYYDLSELIDLDSNRNVIKLFPLTFTCVKQSCTFKKKIPIRYQNLTKNDSAMGSIFRYPNKHKFCVDNMKHNYQFIALCGDAMASGNFHTGLVLNKNLISINKMCCLIDDFIDAYPKDKHGHLNYNFLRLLFFHVNLNNQDTRNDIITKSIENLVNFNELDNDSSTLCLSNILFDLKDVILCQNCSEEYKLLCKNSTAFMKYIINNYNKTAVHRIIKYLMSPDKYKFTDFIKKIHNVEEMNVVFTHNQ